MANEEAQATARDEKEEEMLAELWGEESEAKKAKQGGAGGDEEESEGEANGKANGDAESEGLGEGKGGNDLAALVRAVGRHRAQWWGKLVNSTNNQNFKSN